MKLIIRSRFRNWLEKQDPDKPFCPEHECPLQAYGGRAAYNRSVARWHNSFITEIDKVTPWIRARRGWHILTPSQALEALAKVA